MMSPPHTHPVPFLHPPSWLLLAHWGLGCDTTCKSLGGKEQSGPRGAHARQPPGRPRLWAGMQLGV